MKNILTLLLLLLISGFTTAQEIRINAYGDYVFKDKFNENFVNGGYYQGRIEDGFRWGAGLEYVIQGKTALELQYLRQDTNVPLTYRINRTEPVEFTDLDLAMNYIMFNSTRYFPVNPKLEPFAGGGIGMGIFSAESREFSGDSETKFAWQIRGGANLWLTETVAFRFQASLISVVEAVGGGIYIGSGGIGTNISTYSTIYQFALGGGLVFKLQ